MYCNTYFGTFNSSCQRIKLHKAFDGFNGDTLMTSVQMGIKMHSNRSFQIFGWLQNKAMFADGVYSCQWLSCEPIDIATDTKTKKCYSDFVPVQLHVISLIFIKLKSLNIKSGSSDYNFYLSNKL